MNKTNCFVLFIILTFLCLILFSAPFVPPKIVHPAQEDQDFNLIVDRLEKAIDKAKAEGKESDLVRIEVVLYEPYNQGDLQNFEKFGGKIIHTFEYVSYGFAGTVPFNKINELKKLLSENGRLCVISDDPKGKAHLDFSAQHLRARTSEVWGAGYTGNSSTTVAVLDTGIDDAHTDFSGRVSAGWTDTSSDGYASKVDYNGHGSHVSGIILGSGASLGSGAVSNLTVTKSGFLPSSDGYGFFTMNEVKNTGAGNELDINLAWSGVGTTQVSARDTTWSWMGYNDSGTSPNTISYASETVTGVYKPFLGNSSGAGSEAYSALITHKYSSVGDGYNLFRGIAPSCTLLGVKVLIDDGSGWSTDWGDGLDWCVTNRDTYGIRVINMSLGLDNGVTNSTMDNKVNNAVSNGIVVVCSAGNDYSTYTIPSPGNAAKAITVGSINDEGAMTNYSSNGFGGQNKPDVVAPGGSMVAGTLITSVETNDGDAQNNLTDRQSNDYTNMHGTSMASPMVAGLAGLVIDAIGSWTSTEAEALSVKNIILMTASETNKVGEYNWNGGAAPTTLSGNNPTLNRGARDSVEGFGRANADAAIEAVTVVHAIDTCLMPVTLGDAQTNRKATACYTNLTSGQQYDITFQCLSGSLDCDLYVYHSTPDANGNPVILASATNASTGTNESISYTATYTGVHYLVGKYVSGSGTGSHGFCIGTSVSDWVLY